MSDLLYKRIEKPATEGGTSIQEVSEVNSPLKYVSLKVIELKDKEAYNEVLDQKECCVVALSGTVTISAEEGLFTHVGTRKSVFDKKPTDSVYIPCQTSFKIVGETQAKVILCYAPATQKKEMVLISAQENTIEHRGKYQNKRLVHNILPDTSTVSASLLVVEVYTNGGNFSSYPPHKHDQDNLPDESLLEETYYHEINPTQGFVFQRIYTDDRTLDETMSVENEDVVIVPRGYHPVGVPDGYDSYYLNIMAGPTKEWHFHTDTQHAWILDR